MIILLKLTVVEWIAILLLRDLKEKRDCCSYPSILLSYFRVFSIGILILSDREVDKGPPWKLSEVFIVL